MNKTRIDDFNIVGNENDVVEEPFKDQVKEFLKASGEMVFEGKGCRDIVQQSLGNEVKYVVNKCEENWDKVSGKLSFLNDYLPEDRDLAHAWPIMFFVFFIALSVLLVNTEPRIPKISPKEVYLHPPSASRVQLPDGRHLAYHEQGVPADRARFSFIAPHSFLSSRLAGKKLLMLILFFPSGIPGVKYSLLEEFGVLGFSSGAMHAWAALRYIPDRLATKTYQKKMQLRKS
ncbi:hypothetical protein MKX01_030983, partial [Papaver californicum]